MSDVQAASSKKFKSLGLRAVSGLVLLAICGIPIYFGGWAFAVLVAIFGGRMLWEWIRMTDPDFPILAFLIPLAALLSALYLAQMGEWNLAIIIALIAAVLAAVEKTRRGHFGWAMLGSLYILLPCIAIVWIRGDMIGFQSAGFAKIVFIVGIVAAADSWAYIGGSLLKGPKLAPRISPNKTWSGFLSGLLFGAVFGMICAVITGFSASWGLLLAIPVVIFSVLGDLFESALKRKLNVKDAGGVIPGHGGLLDRVDSLMLAVFVSALALMFWPNLWPM